MRSKFFAVAAALGMGAAVLAGCQQQVEEQAVEEEAPAYDLSEESNARFLADNAAKEGVMTTATGLQYRVLQEGGGPGLATPDDVVTVSYRGWMIDGTVFDETAPGETYDFQASQLISGWAEALTMMHEGDEWEIVIPSELAYGAFGAAGIIPPNQTLVFNLQLHAVAPAPQ